MIIGIILRNIKTYRGINYIPLTDEDRFCGLVGDNGIGKSSVLESLDSYFNDKALNLNIATKKSGLVETKPLVVPIFLVPKSDVPGYLQERAETLSSLALSITEADVNSSNKGHVKRFITHRDAFVQKFDVTNYYLIPIGVTYNGLTTISFFNCRKLVELHVGLDADPAILSLSDVSMSDFASLQSWLKQSIDYIYIPKEIDSESFTKLETAEIQSLMGETLNQILEARVTPAVIADINRNLNDFIEKLSSELEVYSYRTPTDRQQNLRKNDVYNLIIQAFFNIRKLHRKQGDSWLDINSLSSGEKQKAIIDVAHSLISKHRASGANLIIAVDEPESSLHMSACFDQFDSLYEISRSCRQLIFSTHWYGFFPTIESGSACVITKKDNEHHFDLINLANHREQVKQLAAQTRGLLPYDIRLKSINDFVQSIITSTMAEEPFSWLICEGSSEKLYLSEYYRDLIAERRLRIVPVGGAKEIRRLYNHLSVSYEEFRDEIKGNIILLSDTDAELVNYETQAFKRLICRRLVNDPGKRETRLVNINSNPVSPPTEIEDALNGVLFYDTLRQFMSEFDKLNFLESYESSKSEPAYFSLDLRQSERDVIVEFFDTGNNKYVFAKKFCEGIQNELQPPGWVQEIRNWLTQ
jgi:predicted ATPase